LRRHLIIASHIVKMSVIIDANKGWQALIEYSNVLMRLNCIRACLTAMGCVARTLSLVFPLIWVLARPFQIFFKLLAVLQR